MDFWGLALGDRAQTMMLNVVGLGFIPLQVRIVVTVMVRAIIITRTIVRTLDFRQQ